MNTHTDNFSVFPNLIRRKKKGKKKPEKEPVRLMANRGIRFFVDTGNDKVEREKKEKRGSEARAKMLKVYWEKIKELLEKRKKYSFTQTALDSRPT